MDSAPELMDSAPKLMDSAPLGGSPWVDTPGWAPLSRPPWMDPPSVYPPPWVGLGGSFVELGEVQEAHNAFAQAVRQDPLHHGGYLGLAKTATDKRSAGRFSHLAQVVTDTAGSTSPLEDIVAFPNVGDGSTVESVRHSSEYRFISSKAVSKLIGLLADEVVHAADLLHARRVDPAHESAVPSLWSDTLSRFELDETPLYIVENG